MPCNPNTQSPSSSLHLILTPSEYSSERGLADSHMFVERRTLDLIFNIIMTELQASRPNPL